MFSQIKQSLALFTYNLKSVRRRIWISLSMVLSVSLVVLVLLGFLAMSNGFKKSLSQTGSNDIAIALAAGAASELGSEIETAQIHALQSAPELAHADDGSPLMSRELVVPVSARKKTTGDDATLPLRGIGQFGLAVRPTVDLAEGRMFTPGAREIVVGKRVAETYDGFKLGESVTLGNSKWTVVGVFNAGGAAFEGEIFADNKIVQTLFNRPNLVQSIRFRVYEPADIKALDARFENDPRLAMVIKSEKDYFSNMASGTSNLIRFLGWPLAIAMAVGAAIGAMTTMFSSVSDRAVEIATMRCIGFSRTAAFVSTWLEALVLAALGASIGVMVAFLLFQGRSASTTGGDNIRIGFELALSPGIVIQAVVLAMIVGAIGGGFPALSATRTPLRQAMTGRA